MRLWRISNHADLSGAGGLRAGGRWHGPGRPIVYCSTSAAACLLEALVHIGAARPDKLPTTFQLLTIDVPDGVPLPAPDLPEGWQTCTPTTRAIGDEWLRSGKSLLLAVPSVIVPDTTNVLLNPLHPDVGQARIASVATHPFDPRLLRPR